MVRTLKVKQLIVVASGTVLIMVLFSYLYVEPLHYPANNGFDPVALDTYLRDNELVDTNLDADEPRNQTQPKNVFFLKLHKCASSTVQNILMRYGDKHHLNFVLPYSYNYLGHPESFEVSMAMPLGRDTDTFNVFCHHSRFSDVGVKQVMPKGTIQLAIVRNPVDLFESIFSYYEFGDIYQMSLEQFVSMPRWWLSAVPRLRGRIGFNQMAFDFGMPESSFPDADKVSQYIRFLDTRFDLVMVAEYFDESLVLMKELLGLDFEDIVYFKQNERFTVERQNLTEDVKNKIRTANHVDVPLYDHFVNVFRERVRQFGEQRMASELAQYRHWNNFWFTTCGTSLTNRDESLPLFRPFSTKVKAFQLKDNPHSTFCETMAKAELPFTEELRSKHIVRHGTRWQQFLNAVGF